MEAATYIVDPFILVDGIHEIKQWIYDGSLRILVPISTFQEVEQQHKASLVIKEPPKDAATKKPSGRQTRREHPLFDINPRTTWEFLTRAQSWSKDEGVKFQAEGEEFSQWKEEEEAEKLKTPPAAPTSFVEALQSRVLNPIGSEMAAALGPAKPKLVPRSNETKSPWKLHKVPKIPADSIPKNYRSLFSCVLWRLYEFDNNPVHPEKVLIFTDDARVKAVAASLDLPVHDKANIRALVAEKAPAALEREQEGLLEKDFPFASKIPASTANKSQYVERASTQATRTSKVGKATADAPKEHFSGKLASETANGNAHHSTNGFASGTQETKVSNTSPPPSHLAAPFSHTTDQNTNDLLDTLIPRASSPEQDQVPASMVKTPKDFAACKVVVEPEFESDEDVIVFNPRAKRQSGRPHTPAKPPDMSKSRPGTADGKSAAIPDLPKPTRSPIVSNLKPQSPVFTPGQIYAPALEAAHQTPSTPPPTHQNGILPHPAKSPARSPLITHAKMVLSKSSDENAHVKGAGNDQLQRQQSEMIIKRQREAIQRQAKAASKPPPRKVQMEPTDNPTVIDPDAFDRSYVVQQPAATAERGTARRRTGGAGGRQRQSPRESPRQPGRVAAEPDVDFVLKSGTPRGASRGKGKLWVP